MESGNINHSFEHLRMNRGGKRVLPIAPPLKNDLFTFETVDRGRKQLFYTCKIMGGNLQRE